MKKTLIALALASVPFSAAMADVTLYGQVKAGIDVTSYKDDAKKSQTDTQLNDYGSRIGFKGSENLGGGLKAIWQFEQKFLVVGGWSGARNTFIGLQHDLLGTLRVGRLNGQFSNMDRLDPWTAQGIQGVTEGGRHSGIRYDSPEFAGLSATVLYVPNYNTVSGEPLADGSPDAAGLGFGKDQFAVDAGLNYNFADYFAQYGVKYVKNYAISKDETSGKKTYHGDWTSHRVEGGFDNGTYLLGAGYRYDKLKNVDALHSVLVTGGWNLSDALGLKATVEYRFDNSEKNKSKNDMINVLVGADYNFTKRTQALVEAGWMKDKAVSDDAVIGVSVGMVHKF